MGLERGELEWHPHQGGWVAREAIPFETNISRFKYRRYAHVNLYDMFDKPIKGKVLARLVNRTKEVDHYLDNIESAKLWVEAIFALEQ